MEGTLWTITKKTGTLMATQSYLIEGTYLYRFKENRNINGYTILPDLGLNLDDCVVEVKV